jgi:hypothetical protein
MSVVKNYIVRDLHLLGDVFILHHVKLSPWLSTLLYNNTLDYPHSCLTTNVIKLALISICKCAILMDSIQDPYVCIWQHWLLLPSTCVDGWISGLVNMSRQEVAANSCQVKRWLFIILPYFVVIMKYVCPVLCVMIQLMHLFVIKH